MSNIDWNQKRNLFRNTETGEIYVRVETGYMLVEDYIEGGRVELEAHVRPLEKIGQFTNAQIDNGAYLEGEGFPTDPMAPCPNHIKTPGQNCPTCGF